MTPETAYLNAQDFIKALQAYTGDENYISLQEIVMLFNDLWVRSK